MCAKNRDADNKEVYVKVNRVLNITFRFWGPSLEVVLDRLPIAKVIGREGNKYLVEADVFGEGIKI